MTGDYDQTAQAVLDHLVYTVLFPHRVHSGMVASVTRTYIYHILTASHIDI